MSSKLTNLKNYNSFGVEAHCKEIFIAYTVQDVFQFLIENNEEFMVLGGGSNVLFTQDFKGKILSIQIKGIEIIDEDKSSILVKVGAGENWHQFVQWCVSHDLGGLENLALIPGSCGAAPIQNIGAYGIEQNSCFHSLNYIDVENGLTRTMYREDCQFGYRDSIFKRELKGKFIITHVTYMLIKGKEVNIGYNDVLKKLETLSKSTPTIRDVNQAIIEIRTEKLPDPSQTGNAGSFFKNPIISQKQFEILKSGYPEIAHYPAGDGVKLAAAWLIDQCGFKGMTQGNTGTHPNQALVIINRGNATGIEIYNFAMMIKKSVKDKFGVELETEVNII